MQGAQKQYRNIGGYGQAFSGFEIIFVLPFVFFIRPISQGTALVNNTKLECAWKRIPGMFEKGGKDEIFISSCLHV